jgi:hypothetical protein
METSGPQQVGFESDIKPLFRAKDREAMRGRFDLWAYSDVVEHAGAIGQQLSDGSMPCDGAWPAQQVELFQRWVEEGAPQ